MSRGLWKIAWRSFGEAFAFLLPWLILPFGVALLFFVPQAIEPFYQARPPVFVALLRLSQVAGGGISLGALVAALTGFAVKQWEWARKELQEEVKQARADIAEMGMLLQSRQWARGLQCYRRCRQAKESGWLVDRVREELERAWEKETPAELRRFQDYCEQAGTKRTRLRFFRRIGANARRAAEAFLWASQNLGADDYEQATMMMAALLNPETVVAVASVIKGREHDEGVRTWLRDDRLRTALSDIAGQDGTTGPPEALTLLNISKFPARLPPLWRNERPEEPRDIQAAVRGLGCREETNPFGPLKAEEDPLLPKFWVPPPWWERICQLKPTLVVGPLGSGKTATALRLAYEWQENTSLRDDCFPVYGGHLAALEPGETWLNRLACLLGEKLVAFVGHNPYTFLEQKPTCQAAVAQLIYLWAGSEQKLTAYFETQGLEYREGLGARLWQELSRHSSTRVSEDGDERELLDLLGRARPAGRKTTVLLFEVTDPQVLQMAPVIEEPVTEESSGLAATSDSVMLEALAQLLNRLGKKHPRYTDAEILQYRLRRNIYETQLHGASAEHRVERAEIVEVLNRFALATLGSSFFDMCQSAASFIASRNKLIQLARSATLRTLLELVAPLSQRGILLKVFTPEPPGREITWEQDLVPLEWAENSIEELLKKRLEYAGLSGALRSPPPQSHNFEDELVRLAAGSPGRLIALGNELLRQAGMRPGPVELTKEDRAHLRKYAGTLAL